MEPLSLATPDADGFAASGPAACFRLTNVCKTYALEGGGSIQPLQKVSVSLPWNATIAVLGHSGAGKSTLLHLLGLLDTPDPPEGRAALEYWDGQRWLNYGELGSLSSSVCAHLRHRHFGFVFQNHHLLGHLTCAENVALGLTLAGQPQPQRQQRSRQLLQALHIEKCAAKKPHHVSGGEAQRVAVLRAIAHAPRVVLADEPTGNLDARNAAQVLDVLSRWRQDSTAASPRTLILVTHDIQAAFRYADVFLILSQGGIYHNRLLERAEVATPAALLDLVQLSAQPGASPTVLPDFPQLHAGRLALSDLIRLAWRDLFRREHFWGTLATLLILFFMIVLVFIGVSFQSAQHVLIGENIRHPRMLALPVNALHQTGNISAEIVAQIHALRGAHGEPLLDEQRGGAFRWNTAHELFYEGQQAPEKLAQRRSVGRSVQSGDPFLCYIEGATETVPVAFSHEQAREILATKKLLSEVCKTTPTATTVWLHYQEQPIALRVIGVVDKLPGVDEFVLPDGLYQSLNNGSFTVDPLVAALGLQPFTEAQRPRAAAFLRKRLAEEGLPLSIRAEGKTLHIAFADGSSWPLQLFRERVAQWRAALVDAGIIPAESVQITEPPPMVAEPVAPTFGMATVYVRRLEDMEETAAKLESEVKLGVDHTFLHLVRLIVHTIQPLAAMLFWLVVCAIGLAGLNLLITMSRRIAEKHAEIGILKASGMTTRGLVLLFAVEGLLQSMLVLLPAVLVGLLVRQLVLTIVQGMLDTPDANTALQTVGWEMFWLLPLLLLLCPLLGAAAAWLTALRQPAELVQ